MTQKNCCTLNTFNGDYESYWNSVFEEEKTHNWQEGTDLAIDRWLENPLVKQAETVMCAGVGDSFLVDKLLQKEHTQIIANDISELALRRLQKRIGTNEAVEYVAADLMQADRLLQYEQKLDVWIDRATLHFFTTCADKDRYFQLVDKLLKPNGIAIIGVFSKNNVATCCGLELQLWSQQSLQNRFKGYEVLDAFHENFTEQDSTHREYVYLMVQKNK
ncbi:MAG: class I SAM-dependent methyltransferase [Chitinophagales bacterium]